MAPSAKVIDCSVPDGTILQGPSQEVKYRVQNISSATWPPGLTFRPDNGGSSSSSLETAVLPRKSAEIVLTLDLSKAKPGRYVLWFELYCSEEKLGYSASLEFLLKPTRRILRQIFDLFSGSSSSIRVITARLACSDHKSPKRRSCSVSSRRFSFS